MMMTFKDQFLLLYTCNIRVLFLNKVFLVLYLGFVVEGKWNKQGLNALAEIVLWHLVTLDPCWGLVLGLTKYPNCE